MTKVQITLTDQETRILTDASKKHGYPLYRFVKFVIAKEVAQRLSQQDKNEYVENLKSEETQKSHNKMIRAFQRDGGDLWE